VSLGTAIVAMGPRGGKAGRGGAEGQAGQVNPELNDRRLARQTRNLLIRRCERLRLTRRELAT
jgi:hypothetical protein